MWFHSACPFCVLMLTVVLRACSQPPWSGLAVDVKIWNVMSWLSCCCMDRKENVRGGSLSMVVFKIYD